VIRQSSKLVIPGLTLGLGLAVALGQLLKGMLYMVPQEHSGLIYGVSAHDPRLLMSATLLLALLGLMGSFFPARRATQIDPITALRHE
jgi:ABC-type antimicrobial peptide transport system permease subunit